MNSQNFAIFFAVCIIGFLWAMLLVFGFFLMEIDAKQDQNISYILAGEQHILQIIKPILLISNF